MANVYYCPRLQLLHLHGNSTSLLCILNNNSVNLMLLYVSGHQTLIIIIFY